MLEALLHIFFWPGDTVMGWLQTSHPALASWLGLADALPGQLTSALLSALLGWGLFSALCQILLLAVRCWESRQARRGVTNLGEKT